MASQKTSFVVAAPMDITIPGAMDKGFDQMASMDELTAQFTAQGQQINELLTHLAQLTAQLQQPAVGTESHNFYSSVCGSRNGRRVLWPRAGRRIGRWA